MKSGNNKEYMHQVTVKDSGHITLFYSHLVYIHKIFT